MLGFVEFLHLNFFFQFWLQKPHPSPTPHHPYSLGTLQISARSWHSPTSEAGGQSLRLTLCDMTAIVFLKYFFPIYIQLKLPRGTSEKITLLPGGERMREGRVGNANKCRLVLRSLWLKLRWEMVVLMEMKEVRLTWMFIRKIKGFCSHGCKRAPWWWTECLVEERNQNQAFRNADMKCFCRERWAGKEGRRWFCKDKQRTRRPCYHRKQGKTCFSKHGAAKSEAKSIPSAPFALLSTLKIFLSFLFYVEV